MSTKLGEGQHEGVAERGFDKDWVVEKIFGVETVNIVVGDAGSKKTFSMMDLAMCAALGKDWMGRRTLQTGVLWVDEESGERRMRQRLKAAMAAHLPEGASQAEREAVPFYFSSVAGYDLGNSRDISGLAERAREYGCGLIVVDSLAGALGSVDENSLTQLGGMFRLMRWLCGQTGAAVVLIHHTNKAGVYRGSSSFKGYTDVMMEVRSGAHTELMVFDTAKGRDAERQRFGGEMIFEEGMVRLEGANLVEAALRVGTREGLSAATEFVLGYLGEHTVGRLTDMRDAMGSLKYEKVRRALYWLVEKGVVERVDEGGQGAMGVFAMVGAVEGKIRMEYGKFVYLDER